MRIMTPAAADGARHSERAAEQVRDDVLDGFISAGCPPLRYRATANLIK